MTLHIIQTIISVTIAFLVAFATLRNDKTKKLTSRAYWVIICSIVGGGLALYSAKHEKQEEELRKFRLVDSDIEIRLTAIVPGEAPSEELEKLSPDSVQIGLIVTNEGGWNCFLEPVPGFVSTGYSRSAPSAKRMYTTKLTQQIEGREKNSLDYLWDLNGKEITIMRHPRLHFSKREWNVEAKLLVRNHVYLGKPDGAGLKFEIDGLDRKTLTNP